MLIVYIHSKTNVLSTKLTIRRYCPFQLKTTRDEIRALRRVTLTWGSRADLQRDPSRARQSAKDRRNGDARQERCDGQGTRAEEEHIRGTWSSVWWRSR